MTTTEHADAALSQHIAELPDRLRSYRERSGLNLRELATAIGGMNHSTLHRIERGEDFTVSRLLAITTYLDGQSS